MDIFNISEDKCVKCGMCAEVCPVKLIVFKPERFPRQVPWAEKVCIDCGHCVSVCPQGALNHRCMKQKIQR